MYVQDSVQADEWNAVVYEGIQRLTAKWSGQVVCPCRTGHERLTDGQPCHCCHAQV